MSDKTSTPKEDIFSGNKTEYPDWKSKLNNKLLAIRCFDIVYVTPNVEDIKDIPAEPAEALGERAYNRWKLERAEIIRYNEEYKNREAKGFGIITAMCSTDLQRSLEKYRGDPRAAVEWLDKMYALDMQNPTEKAKAKTEFRNCIQRPGELFSNYYLRFDYLRTKSGSDESDGLARIIDRNYPAVAQRLLSTVADCVLYGKDYEETIQLLTRKDADNLANGLFKHETAQEAQSANTGNSKKAAKRARSRRDVADDDDDAGAPKVSEETFLAADGKTLVNPSWHCNLCNNYGHSQKYCKSKKPNDKDESVNKKSKERSGDGKHGRNKKVRFENAKDVKSSKFTNGKGNNSSNNNNNSSKKKNKANRAKRESQGDSDDDSSSDSDSSSSTDYDSEADSERVKAFQPLLGKKNRVNAVSHKKRKSDVPQRTASVVSAKVSNSRRVQNDSDSESGSVVSAATIDSIPDLCSGSSDSDSSSDDDVYVSDLPSECSSSDDDAQVTVSAAASDRHSIANYSDSDVELPVRVRRSKNKSARQQKVQSDKTFKLRVDSGADLTCAPSTDILSKITNVYKSESAQTRHELQAADGYGMKCVARGTIDEYIKDVHIIPTLSESLLSVGQLQKEGLWIVFPADSAGCAHSSYTCDGNGKIIYAADGNSMVDVRDKFDHLPNIQLPVIDDPSPSKARRVRTYGVRHELVKDEVLRWHIALNHPCEERMCGLCGEEGSDRIIPLTARQVRAHFPDCAHCHAAKMTRRPMNRYAPVTKPDRELKTGEVVVRDIYGPVMVGKKKTYFETLVDVKSKKGNVYDVRKKPDVVNNTYAITAEYAKNGHKISVIRSDSDSVYKSEEMRQTYDRLGITGQYEVPYTHQVLVENRHKQWGNIVTALMHAAPWAPPDIYFKAVKHACFVENLFPHPGTDGKSSYEAFYNTKPDLVAMPLFPWGQPMSALIPPEVRKGKFADKSFIGMYTGVAEGTKYGVEIYNPATKQFVIRDQYVVLKEVPKEWPRYPNRFHIPKLLVKDDSTAEDDVDALTSPSPTENDDLAPTAVAQEGVNKPLISQNQEGVEYGPATAPTDAIEPAGTVTDSADTDAGVTVATTADSAATGENTISPAAAVLSAMSEEVINTVEIPESGSESERDTTRSGRHHRLPSRYANRATRKLRAAQKKLEAKLARRHTPGKYVNAAMKVLIRKHAEERQKVRKVKKKHTEDHPSYKQAIHADNPERKHWVAAQKAEDDQVAADGVLEFVDASSLTEKERKNAIPCHYEMTKKRDAEGKLEKYKARLVGEGNRQRESTYDDIKSPTARGASVKLAAAIAVKAKFKIRVFDVKGAYLKVKVEDGIKLHLRMPDGRYALLKKYLYGLKQSGLKWHEHIKSLLIRQGYVQSKADPCVFTFIRGLKYVNIVLHVDDLFCTASSDALLDRLYDQLTKEYGEVTMKSGDSFTYLGMKFEITKKGILLSQPGAVDKLLRETGMEDCKPALTPEAVTPPNIPNGDEPVDNEEYRSVLGMTNYISCCTRPELLHKLSKLASKSNSPTRADAQ